MTNPGYWHQMPIPAPWFVFAFTVSGASDLHIAASNDVIGAMESNGGDLMYCWPVSSRRRAIRIQKLLSRHDLEHKWHHMGCYDSFTAFVAIAIDGAGNA